MKKLLARLLAALMMISVVACVNKDTSGTDSQLESLKGSRNETAKTEDTYNEYDTFQFEEVDTKTVRIVGFSTTLDRAHEVKIPTYF
jgi:outer membrane lipoprotein SlyB